MTGTSTPKRSPASVIVAAIKALRPKQWAKNVLLFAPLVFSAGFLDPRMVLQALAAVAAFSLLASSGYILNDYLDRASDRQHPRKRHRPIASGSLPEAIALVEMICALSAGLIVAWWVSPNYMIIGIVYLVSTITYSLWLKHIVILDVMVLAFFYLLRVIAGAVAIEVRVSAWLFLCTAFLALFLGFHKRRSEIINLGDASSTRKILRMYSVQTLDQFQAIATGSVVLCYALYTVFGGSTPWMTVTVPFVLYGVFRYLWLVHQKGEGDAPDETLLKDWPMLLNGGLYAITVICVILADQAGVLPDVFHSPFRGIGS
ncbi:MAG: 4-hydroxybenzoate polyprenyltransferase [Kiritimatiellia bacterium]